jgi:hypothetical protein
MKLLHAMNKDARPFLLAGRRTVSSLQREREERRFMKISKKEVATGLGACNKVLLTVTIAIMLAVTAFALSADDADDCGPALAVYNEDFQVNDFWYDYKETNEAILVKYVGGDIVITIPDYVTDPYSVLRKVTVIGDNVFLDRFDILEVTLPDTIEHIGKRAFASTM